MGDKPNYRASWLDAKGRWHTQEFITLAEAREFVRAQPIVNIAHLRAIRAEDLIAAMTAEGRGE